MNNTSQASNPYDRKNIENIFPLSSMQQGLLFHTLLNPKSGDYVPQIVLTLQGQLDQQIMQQAWEDNLQKHSALRCGFYWEQRDEPYQIQFKQLPFTIMQKDWLSSSEKEQSQQLHSLLAYNRTESFNLKRPPLIRIFWCQLDDNRVHLLCSYHHLILDGWSMAIILREVIEHYQQLITDDIREVIQISPPYSEYIRWLKSLDNETSLAYWKHELQDIPEMPYLPIGENRYETHKIENLYLERKLTTKDSDTINAFLKTKSLTFNTLIQAAFALLLRRYGNPDDIIFGTTVSGRPANLTGSMQMVGLFINTIPIKICIEPSSNVIEWLNSIQLAHQARIEHEYVPLRDIQSMMNLSHGLFNCLLVIESYPIDTLNSQQATKALSIDNIQYDESTHLPLTLQAAPGDMIHLSFRAKSAGHDKAILEHMLEHLETIILNLVKKTNDSISSIDMISKDEDSMMNEWNQTSKALNQNANLLDLFLQQVEKTPDHPALVYQKKKLSYRELNNRSNQLANVLLQSGITRQTIVGVYLERSFELIIAVWAIQKVGATYLPLDSNQPNSRINSIIADSQPKLILHQVRKDAWALDTPPDCQLVDLATTDLNKHDTDSATTLAQPKDDDISYIIYTSGSTGQPKGVPNTQLAITNQLLWMQSRFSITPNDRILQKTPISFDVSIWELFLPNICGATLVLAAPDGHLDREYLHHLIKTENISVSHFVPSMLNDFLLADTFSTEDHDLPSLRLMICSGEALYVNICKKFFDTVPTCQLFNLYGPTEASIDVTAYECNATLLSDLQTAPIGNPVANTQIYLFDEDYHRVPIGARGKLYIGGIGLATGYLNQANLTQEKFITNPFDPDSIIYDSGDYASYDKNGLLSYLGRDDNQIKIHGHRIELGEIENSLVALDNIKQAAVKIILNDQKENLLIACVVNISEADQINSNERDVINLLRTNLPDAMIPSRIIFISEMPMTTSGKINRRALPDSTEIEQEHVSPRTQTEEIIAHIWHECLNLKNTPSVNMSFFSLGGHSLIATRIVNRVKQSMNIDMPLSYVFEYPSIEELSTQIDKLVADMSSTNDDNYREQTL
ncbi:MAG: amino acid adenylation domain-containing protein [Pseudomonadota bacterium]